MFCSWVVPCYDMAVNAREESTVIAIAVSNGGTKPVLDLNEFLDMVARDYQLDASDVANLITEASTNPNRFPAEIRNCFENVADNVTANDRNNSDGVWGDDYYVAKEQIENAQEEIRDEIDALRSSKRKGNTKEDIARRLDCIVSNMNGIL